MFLRLQGAAPLKFAIFFAGALIRDRNLSYIYKEKVPLPSVHIIGDKDYVKEVEHHQPVSLTWKSTCFLIQLLVSSYICVIGLLAQKLTCINITWHHLT